MGIKELLKLIAGSLGATSEELSSVRTVKDCLRLIANHVTSGSGGFDLSDRMAKGVDDHGNIVTGAVIEGSITPGVFINKAIGLHSHAEGTQTTASGAQSHAEGSRTTSSGVQSHAEGCDTTSSGAQSHAEGIGTTSSGMFSHAEGLVSVASGLASHADGIGTKACGKSEHVFGAYNIPTNVEDSTSRSQYIEIVGNGYEDDGVDVPSNARTLDWDGNEAISGSLTLGLGTENAVTISPQQLAQLLNLLNT